MQAFHEIVRRILNEGVRKPNRTGVPAISIAGAMFEHDMAKGFPLLTTKKTPFKVMATELEFFIKGLTDKHWLQERNCHIWDEWANPKKAPYGTDDASKKRMLEERDLGPIYGFQWRHFGADYLGHDAVYTGVGVDQLALVLNTLKKNPYDRRMIVMAWNPLAMDQMGLPPCHYGYQLIVTGDGDDKRLNLIWEQRSVDTMLGLPFNIASYGLLLHLISKESGIKAGKLIGQLGDVHIYENHLEGTHEFLSRDPEKYPLPTVVTDPFMTVFEWEASHSRLEGYESYPKIELPIAV